MHMSKKVIFIGAIVAILIVVLAAGADANPRFGFRGGIWIGPGWGPWWWGPPAPLYPYPYYAEPPVVIQQQPPVIYEQQPAEETYYWYYCSDPQGYYPYVKQCPKGWMKVVPTPPPAPAK
jgi:hypothetical protein